MVNRKGKMPKEKISKKESLGTCEGAKKKRGGTKRKVAIEKISKEESLRTCHTKRTYGLFSKASKLCLLSPQSQIAVLATPSSSNSNVSFFSFGHSSVDSVVSAYLTGQRPRKEEEEKDLGLGFWWEDESLHNSDDPEELKAALESMRILMEKVKTSEDHGDETLNLQSTCMDLPPLDDYECLSSLMEQTNNNNHHQQLCIQETEQTSGVQSKTGDNETILGFQDASAIPHEDLLLKKTSEEQDQTRAICDSFNNTSQGGGNLDEWWDQEMIDICHNFDFNNTTTTTTCDEALLSSHDWDFGGRGGYDDIAAAQPLNNGVSSVLEQQQQHNICSTLPSALDEENLFFSQIYSDFTNTSSLRI